VCTNIVEHIYRIDTVNYILSFLQIKDLRMFILFLVPYITIPHIISCGMPLYLHTPSNVCSCFLAHLSFPLFPERPLELIVGFGPCGPHQKFNKLHWGFSLRVAKVCGGLCVQLFAQPELNTSPDNHRWNLQMPEDTSSVATFLDRAAEARCGVGKTSG